ACSDYPRSGDRSGGLFGSAYAHGFDVPARSGEAIARLELLASKLGSPALLKQRIRQLSRIRKDWIKQMQEYVQKVDQRRGKQFIAASLGDARAAIELFSQPGYEDIPEYRERLRDARRKLCEEESQPRRSLPLTTLCRPRRSAK